MPLAADHPFLEVFGTILIFFLFVGWFGLLIVTIGDVFSRHDIRGGKKGPLAAASYLHPVHRRLRLRDREQPRDCPAQGRAGAAGLRRAD
jgi:hypothetical protein